MLGPGTLTVLFLVTLKATVVYGTAVPEQPYDVHFQSFNLRNVLRWSPGRGNNNGTRYTVQYKIYGGEIDVWHDQKQCTNITGTCCDLSRDTSDLAEGYFARVKAVSNGISSDWTESKRFHPKLDTIIGPPSLEVRAGERSIFIWLRGPFKWQTDNKTKVKSMAKYYRSLQYNVSLYNNKTKQLLHFLLKNYSGTLDRLDHDTQYCVSARTKVQGQISDPSEELCVTTPKDTFSEWLVVIMFGCVLPSMIALLLIFVVFYLIYRYVFGNHQKTPKNLLLQYHCEREAKVVFVPYDLKVNLITSNVFNTRSKTQQVKHSPAYENQSTSGFQPAKHLGYTSQLVKHLSAEDLEALASDEDQQHEAPNYRRQTGMRPLSEYFGYGTVLNAQLSFEQDDKLPENEDLMRSVSIGVSQEAAFNPSFETHLISEEEAVQQVQIRKGQAQVSEGRECQQFDIKLSLCWDFPEEAEQGEGTVLVDWDPESRTLHMPILHDSKRADCDVEEKTDLLPTVYLRQSSREPSDIEEVYVSRLVKNWGLQE
ncbi:interleukin-20 receptor subunit alpha-like isoform X2 [Polyodon spathula]|uniref:interleukin-20 receptor subunit alpha-like isoform X2 n=1 Tax=Polyodon spathula TaxID=7913 RepID=UPI001B7E6E12|nr:interleukin-20 receptor subunit alpha-like isoform X2 [Polyodon spathula]